MGLDPDVLRSKPRRRVERWLNFAGADAAYEDYRHAEAEAALDRQIEGGS